VKNLSKGNNVPKGVLILVSGPALAGKSTFLDVLHKKISSLHIISTDDIRKEFFDNFAYVIENEPFVWKTAYQRMLDHLTLGHSVCLDATLRTIVHRQEIKNLFKDFPILYFAFEKPPLEVLLTRNKERSWKQFPEEAIERMHKDYQFPSMDEQLTYDFFAPVPYPSSSTIIDDYLPTLKKNFFEST
jgi:predicted kinase